MVKGNNDCISFLSKDLASKDHSPIPNRGKKRSRGFSTISLFETILKRIFHYDDIMSKENEKQNSLEQKKCHSCKPICEIHNPI